MSILIQGMDMPKNCAECKMWSICECLNDFEDFESICYAVEDGDLVRDKNCPLIELPPHGRLIDADKLNIHDVSPAYGFRVMGVTEEDIELADTVIEAEGDMSKQNEINVGDEVNWLGDCFIVTRIFQPRNGKEQCDGIDDDGCVYHDVLIKDLEKTGRHFDIASILEDMRND